MPQEKLGSIFHSPAGPQECQLFSAVIGPTQPTGRRTTLLAMLFLRHRLIQVQDHRRDRGVCRKLRDVDPFVAGRFTYAH
jgi:hypothetical protein